MLLHRRFTLAALVAGTLAVTAIAVAQERDQPQPRRSDNAQPENPAAQPGRRDADRNADTRRPTAGEAANSDAELAACLIISNHQEVALAQFAQQHAQDAAVKEFAQQLIQDHEQFAAELQKFADQGGYEESQLAVRGSAGAERNTANRNQPGERNQPGATDQNTTQPRRTAREPQLDANNPDGARQPGDRGELDFVSIKQEIAQECVQSAEKELGEKSESEFDRCYIGSQVFAHMEMSDTLKVLQKHASPELQALLQKGEQTTQQHLDRAKELAQQLETGQGTTGNEREGTPTRRPNATERPGATERPNPTQPRREGTEPTRENP